MKGLPLAGPGTYEFGLGLWRELPLELGMEAVMATAAAALYWRATQDRGRARRIGMIVYIAALSALAIGGQAASGDLPGRSALIANWIAAPLVFAAIPGWLDRT